MRVMEAIALALVLLLLFLAVGVPLLLSRLSSRRQRVARRIGRIVVGVAAGTALLLALLTVPNAFRSDAIDRLRASEQATVRAAVGVAAGCSQPFTHVAEVTPPPGRDVADGFSYRCEWSVLGWPSFTGEAKCADGTWRVPGWRDEQATLRYCRSSRQ